MSIHSEHPFMPPAGDRDPLRRFRGRMPQPVTLWCAEEGTTRAGWTVSSVLVADGQPAEVAGVIDGDSDLASLAERTRAVAISLLGWQHRGLADAFAGLAPAPGGVFRLARWTTTRWGPVLDDAVGWLGVDLVGTDERLGWGLLFRGRCSSVHVAAAADEGVLTSVRGRYRSVPLD